MSPLKRISIFLAVSACVVVAVVVSARDSQDDVLAGFGLEMPPCETEDQTFSGTTSYPNSYLRMSFTAPRDCVERYLRDHDVEMATPLHWPAAGTDRVGSKTFSPTDPPFSDDAMKQFGLKLDPKKKYDYYIDFRTARDAEFTVFLVPRGERTEVYMDVFSPGRAKGSGNMR